MSDLSNREFLELVLPKLRDGESYVVAANEPKTADNAKGKRRHIPTKVGSLDEIFKEWERIENKEKYNTFYRIGSVDTDAEKINVDAVRQLKTILLDIDVGKDSPDSYANKTIAKKSIDKFLQQFDKLPKPYVIDSGNGFHIYWPFEEPVDREIWMQLTSDFAEYLKDNDCQLLIDPSVIKKPTQDIRLVGSRNFNTNGDNTKELYVAVLEKGEVSTYQYFRDLIPKSIIAPKVPYKEKIKNLSEYQKSLMESSEKKFSVIKEKSLKGEGCGQIKLAYEDPTKVQYDTWMSLLSTAQHCSDREWAIHDISKTDTKRYNKSVTEMKANEMQHPHNCSTYAASNPTPCEDCPHKQLINPINLGSVVKELKDKKISSIVTPGYSDIVKLDKKKEVKKEIKEEPKPPVKQVKEKDSKIPDVLRKFIVEKPPEVERAGEEEQLRDPPENFKYGEGKNLIYHIPPVKNADGTYNQGEDRVIFHSLIYVVRLTFHKEGGYHLALKVVTKHDGVITSEMPMSYLTNSAKNKFLEYMSSTFGYIPMRKNDEDFLRRYLSISGQELLMNETTTSASTKMGWDLENDTFLIGDRLYRAGSVCEAPHSKILKNFIPYLKPNKGASLEKWTEAINKLFANKGDEERAFVLGFSLASPLYALAPPNIKSGLVHMMSEGTGTNKSATLESAFSIWGIPEKPIPIMQLLDTGMSVFARRGALNSIPLMFDEIVDDNQKPKGRLDASTLVFGLASGAGPNRASADNNRERDNDVFWNGATISTSNISLCQAISAIKARPEGELARFLEIDLTDRKATMSTEETTYWMEQVIANSGTAAERYIQYLLHNKNSVEKMVRETFNCYMNSGGAALHNEARYIGWGIGLGMTGVRLGNGLDMWEFDEYSIANSIVKQGKRHLDNINDLNETPIDRLKRFLHDNRAKTVILKSTVDGRSIANTHNNPDIRYAPASGHPCWVRWEFDTNELWVYKKPYDDYCQSNGLNAKSLLRYLLKNNIGRVVKKRIGSGIGIDTVLNAYHIEGNKIGLTPPSDE